MLSAAGREEHHRLGHPSPRSHRVGVFPRYKLHRAKVASPLSLSCSRSTAKRCKEKHLEEALQLTRVLSEGLQALGEAEARPLLRCVLAFQMEATSSCSSFQKLEQVCKAICPLLAQLWSFLASLPAKGLRGGAGSPSSTCQLVSPRGLGRVADLGVSWQMVTQLAVGKEALLAQEVDTLLAGLALQGEVREPRLCSVTGFHGDLSGDHVSQAPHGLGCLQSFSSLPMVLGICPCLQLATCGFSHVHVFIFICSFSYFFQHFHVFIFIFFNIFICSHVSRAGLSH